MDLTSGGANMSVNSLTPPGGSTPDSGWILNAEFKSCILCVGITLFSSDSDGTGSIHGLTTSHEKGNSTLLQEQRRLPKFTTP